ncbi:MAG TPA: tyrosine-type recombinase/integrase [Vicinamibacterales bacterium]|nr:tyrosine-type recombinase/integrase [Vicinamibacterales bacterium]
MSVIVRPYRRGGWEVDIRLTLPDNSEHRERRKAPVANRNAAQRWGEARERAWYRELTDPELKDSKPKEVPSLETFWPRFMDGYARANRQKPSGLAAKETIGKTHLIPQLGSKRLDRITTEDVQQLKRHLHDRSPKTVNNVLAVLSVLLKKAVEWDVIDRMPCAIRLLPISKPSMGFYDFEEYERLIEAARRLDRNTHLIVLMGGDAGLRCGEMMALEWRDVDLHKRQLCVQRSDWKGHVTVPKGGRLRHVPLTIRLATALRDYRHLRSDRVLCQADGSPMSADIVKHHVERAARRAQIAHSGVHRLRHTFCSHLAMRGAPARAIQELAGHQDLTTTQRYMHLSPAALDSAIRLLDSPGMPRSLGDILETGSTETPNSFR